MDLNQKITPHFSLRELTRSDTAVRLGIDNTPSEEHLKNLRILCEQVLEPVRKVYGPVRVNSGYRALAVNMAVNPMTSTINRLSQHCTGHAVDFEVDGVTNAGLARWCVEHLGEWDQIILEFYTPGQPNSGWVHVSYNTGHNRKEILTVVRENSKTVYKVGIVE